MPFCGNCGRQLQPGEVCNCTAVNATPIQPNIVQPVTPVAPNPEGTKKPAKRSKKALGILVGIAALLVVILIILLATGKTYKTPIDQIVKTLNKGTKANTAELMTAGMPKELKEFAKTYIDVSGDELDYWKSYFYDLKVEYPHWKISFKEKRKTKLDKDDLKEYAEKYEEIGEFAADALEEIEDTDVEDMADELDISKSEAKKLIKAAKKLMKKYKKNKVTEGYKVKGYYILKDGSKVVSETNAVNIIILKVNGDWVIDSFEDEFEFKDASYTDEYMFLEEYLNTNIAEVLRSVLFLGF